MEAVFADVENSLLLLYRQHRRHFLTLASRYTGRAMYVETYMMATFVFLHVLLEFRS